jgi:MerR family transcriptional regulator, thiopeptide resistance regulator
MKQEELFEGFSEEKQKEYAAEIRGKYGEDATRESDRRWAGYTAEKKAAIKAESEAIYRELADAMNQHQGAQSNGVQQIVGRWHQHLKYFYEPSTERLRGLGQMYTEHPDFIAMFNKIHPGLADFFNQAIQFYCKKAEKKQ